MGGSGSGNRGKSSKVAFLPGAGMLIDSGGHPQRIVQTVCSLPVSAVYRFLRLSTITAFSGAFLPVTETCH